MLICVDDLDLNISEGFKMAEMIRKYLVNPYSIILIAVKVEQLIDVIANNYRNNTSTEIVHSTQCEEMAQKYVDKLLPRGNRIPMPLITDFCERNLQFVDDNGIASVAEPNFSVKEKVVQMIFQKTGYVFYNTQHLSPIVPKNLRSLRHLFGLLYSLPDARNEEWEDNETGREIFKDYFLGTWVATQLANDDQVFAQQ